TKCINRRTTVNSQLSSEMPAGDALTIRPAPASSDNEQSASSPSERRVSRSHEILDHHHDFVHFVYRVPLSFVQKPNVIVTSGFAGIPKRRPECLIIKVWNTKNSPSWLGADPPLVSML